MAATSHNSTTKKPGPESFTAALIWALKELVRYKPEKRFSTQDLLAKIFNAPDFPKNQAPRLTERGAVSCLRRIVLAPMDNEYGVDHEKEDITQNLKVTQDTLNLRFVFDRVITAKVVRDLAKDVSNLISQGDLGASTVLWEGINSAEQSRVDSQILTDIELQVLEFATAWRNQARRRSRGAHSSIERPHIPVVLPTAASETALMPQESSMSPEESMISTPNPEQIPLSPAPDIRIDSNATSTIDDASHSSQKRKRDGGELYDSESIDATSSLPPLLGEKRLKILQFDDQDSSSQPR